MLVYAARIWKGTYWHVVRCYGTQEAAEFFASHALSESEWDVKAIKLDDAVKAGL